MKIFPNLARAVISALQRILENEYADKVIESTLRSNPKWGSRDRSFIASSVYEVIRWKRLYAFMARTPDENPDPALLATVHWTLEGYDTRTLDFLPKVNDREISERLKRAGKIPEIRESIPDWLKDRFQEELGPGWEKEMAELNREASLVIRTNTLKTDPSELKGLLAENNIRVHTDPVAPSALVAEGRANVFRTEEFKNGLFEVQDLSSQLVAPFLMPEPGMRVIDACAGAGGKSLHLAALMQNKGKILSLDVEEYKLTELKRRARRAGASLIETRTITSTKTIKRLAGQADRVLLDVPCSGLGVLKRNPDAKWKLAPEFLDRVQQVQQEILERYTKMVRPGGMVVYATCSILPSENQGQVKRFLEKQDEFEFQEEKIILPSQSGYDGFYMARLKRKESAGTAK